MRPRAISTRSTPATCATASSSPLPGPAAVIELDGRHHAAAAAIVTAGRHRDRTRATSASATSTGGALAGGTNAVELTHQVLDQQRPSGAGPAARLAEFAHQFAHQVRVDHTRCSPLAAAGPHCARLRTSASTSSTAGDVPTRPHGASGSLLPGLAAAALDGS